MSVLWEYYIHKERNRFCGNKVKVVELLKKKKKTDKQRWLWQMNWVEKCTQLDSKSMSWGWSQRNLEHSTKKQGKHERKVNRQKKQIPTSV